MITKGSESTIKASPEDTRTRILEAAREIYVLKGFRGTTTREVAERASVNEATLFRHFGNKEALIEAMFKNACEHDGENLAEFFAGTTADVASDLRLLAVQALHGMAAKRDLILISLAEEPRDPTGFNIMWKTPSVVFERLQAYFAQAGSQGKVHGDPAMNARFFMGMLFAHVMGRCIFGTPNFEEVADYSVDIFLNGIGNK
ncbi:MAG TPA: TetR/AcrR family transcriptional regulator [Candidatus Binatia bacterium]|nr:TetR/AcrR family transcriptional regulator [Candidatus Binatia bacterium]